MENKKKMIIRFEIEFFFVHRESRNDRCCQTIINADRRNTAHKSFRLKFRHSSSFYDE